ncbi:kinase-like protein [Trametopsis cervina]|nr:kinase-like protein [Trametopsis cervina]
MWATVKHEHILALHGIAEPQGLEQMCMISPYMDGKTVSERCPQPPSGMEQGDRRRLIQEIADGMAYLHSEGIVHGDLRGPNVFITRDGHAKIADFGLAVYVSGDVGGSTIYTQALGRPTMFSDVYSFALTHRSYNSLLQFKQMGNTAVHLVLSTCHRGETITKLYGR